MQKILVFEHEKKYYSLLKDLITESFPKCSLFLSQEIQEGLDYALKENPDIIIINILFSSNPSTEISEKIKENHITQHIPILFLINHEKELEEYHQTVINSGDAFFVWPPKPSEFVTQINILLHKSEKAKLSLTNSNNLVLNNDENYSLKNRNKELESELAETKEKLQNIIDNSPSFYYSHDTNHVLTWMSHQVIDILGYTPEECMMAWMNLATENPINELGFEKTVKAIQTGVKQDPYELELRTKGGNKIWVEVREFPHVVNGKTVAIIGTIFEITQQKKTLQELRKSERVYQTLINNLPGFVYRCKNDENWTMLYVSDGCEIITGYRPSDFIENNTIAFNDIIVEEYQSYVQEKWDQGIKNKTTVVLEYPITAKNGQVRWIWERGIGIYSEDGEIIYLEGFITDITEDKNNNRLQKVLFNISNAVSSSDNLENLLSFIKLELGTIIDTTNFYIVLYDNISDTLSLPFFVDQKDKLTTIPAGKTLTKYVIDTKTPLLANIEKKKQLVQEGKIEHVGTLSKIWLGVPLKFDGNIIGVLAIQSYDDENAYDETHMKMLEFVSDQISISIYRKKAEENLLLALQKAEESDRLKSAFLANMSHEIRTPMNGILGFAELLREPDFSDEEQMQFIDIIQKSGRRMLNIINDLIDISRVEAGQVEINISKVDVNEITQDLYLFFKQEVNQKGMELFYSNTLTQSEAIISTDKEKLYAILTNLIKNATKYSHEGNIHFGYVKKKELLEFFVKDTGIGIPEHLLENVFSRFVQVDIKDARTYEGAGLGLAITKAFVEMLGGKIWVKSEVGVGSDFYFTIPVK